MSLELPPMRLAEVLEPSLRGTRVFTSLEGENPGGSIKDHMVLGGLLELRASARLGAGKTIAEASAGSTALSLAYYSHELAIPCALFVPDHLPPEKIGRLKDLGAEIHAVPLSRAMELYSEFCKDARIVPFNQLKDTGKRVHYRSLGAQARTAIGPIDAVIGAVGTGHSLLGIAEGIEPRPHVFTAEPASMEIPGVRNLETKRHGDDDPCVPSLFDHRCVLEPEGLFQRSTILTSLGGVEFPDSFKLVLGA